MTHSIILDVIKQKINNKIDLPEIFPLEEAEIRKNLMRYDNDINLPGLF
jgi:ribosomal protein S3AE